MKKEIILGILFLSLSIITVHANKKLKCYSISSPDKNIRITFKQTPAGEFSYSLSINKKEVINDSPLGFKTETGTTIPSKEWGIEKATRNKVNTVWKPIWGKRAVVPDRYNELKLHISSKTTASEKLEIVARAYNDGVAFKYIIPQDGVNLKKCLSELTAYNFADNYTAWFYNGENHNIGPELLTETDKERMPVMTIKASDNLYMAIHEACLDEGEPLKLKSQKGQRLFTISSKPKTLHPGYQSAWRVILYGSQPGELVDSHLLELLNPAPSADIDFSWVKPGVALWDWRINGAKWGEFTYTMSYPSWVKMVDFAAEEGFKHLVLDANWYGPEFAKDSDPTQGDKARDVQKLIQYGKEKGVGIWLYLNDIGGRHYPLEETLIQYGKWGATGVKYGFMTGSMEEKNLQTKKITEICAKNKLLVNFHDEPVHPYGQARTWPNAVTREYCKAQLDGHEIFYPKTFVTSVFVNMIAGPIDMNNGMFDLRQGKTTRIDNNQEVPSTVVSEAARTLITYSGATIIPDIPEYYRKYPTLLNFLSAQEMPWQESKTLSGEIGEYIVVARQSQKGTWLVGAATNELARTIQVPLDFLKAGEYRVVITQDAPDSHYLHEREKCEAKEYTLTNKETVTLTLAPGGGACILIQKK